MMKCVFFQGPLAQVMVVADPDLYFKKYIKKTELFMCDYRRHYMHVRRVHYFSTKSWWVIWKRMGLKSTHTIHVWRTNGKWQATYAYLAR